MQSPQVTVNVATAGGQYPIHIGQGRLQALAAAIPTDATAVAVIVSETVNRLYGEVVSTSLEALDMKRVWHVIPDGEASKSQAVLDQIYDTLLEHGLDRRAVLIALGGGVVGDITGFAAASYMRGIRFIQVPTTLLAQVDSSVGGKTGINHRLGKNMIGAFHQPIAVEIDTTVLRSLPAREISAGLAEVIKYGMIMDADFFTWCEQHMSGLRSLQNEHIVTAIKRSCELKADVVSQDERESGLRAILNFGHTFGHAIEAGLGYGQWLHGEAVGCGMIQAAQLSRLADGLSQDAVDRIAALVSATGCPTQPPAFPVEQWQALMRSDKKAQGGEIRFVTLRALGSARVQPVPWSHVATVLGSPAHAPEPTS